jgi:hypothetical protein
VTKSDNELVASCRFRSSKSVAFCRSNLSLLVAYAAQFDLTFTFTCSLPKLFATGLSCPVMIETAQRNGGGKPFRSILEPHFEFIRELRQRRKTWRQITELLLTEKGIRVTVFAPYLYYRRKLKRVAKSNWENAGNYSDFQPTRPGVAASRPQSRPSPLPLKPVFKQPNLSTKDTEQFT